MSDTDSKTGNKNPGKLPFTKTGTHSLSQIFTKKNQPPPVEGDPPNINSAPIGATTPVVLDESDFGFTSEMLIGRLPPDGFTGKNEIHAEIPEPLRDPIEHLTARQEANELEGKKEAWQEKVKEDLKRIKLKERELENRYELLRRDTQALLDSKDKHVLELKSKNDALELELDSIEDRLRTASAVLGAVEAKKNRVLETLRLLTGLVEALTAEAAEIQSDRKVG